jgi:hypothetical protein
MDTAKVKSIYPTDVIALAALTLAELLIAQMPKDQRQRFVGNAVKLHLETPAGENELNRRVGNLIREVGYDLETGDKS